MDFDSVFVYRFMLVETWTFPYPIHQRPKIHWVFVVVLSRSNGDDFGDSRNGSLGIVVTDFDQAKSIDKEECIRHDHWLSGRSLATFFGSIPIDLLVVGLMCKLFHSLRHF